MKPESVIFIGLIVLIALLFAIGLGVYWSTL